MIVLGSGNESSGITWEKHYISTLGRLLYVFYKGWVGSEKETGQDIQDLKASHGFCFEIGGGHCGDHRH